MGFETLTLVPFDRRLIDPSSSMPREIAWLNAYHARVRREIEPLLLGDDRLAAPRHGADRGMTDRSIPSYRRKPYEKWMDCEDQCDGCKDRGWKCSFGVAATLTTAAFVPQALHIIRHKETKAISLLMYVAFATGVAFGSCSAS